MTRYLTPIETSRLIGISTKTLKRWRSSAVRKGPPYTRISRTTIRYAEDKLAARMEDREVIPANSSFLRRSPA